MYRETLEQVIRRKNFYRDTYRRVLRMLYVTILVIMALVVIDAYFIFNQKKINYYSTNTEGLIRQLMPLDAPNQSSVALLPPSPPSETANNPKVLNLDLSGVN